MKMALLVFRKKYLWSKRSIGEEMMKSPFPSTQLIPKAERGVQMNLLNS
jgi:hypothetical protein